MKRRIDVGILLALGLLISGVGRPEQALSEKLFWDTDLTQVEGLKAAVAKALYEIDHNDMETACKNFIQFYS